MEAAHFFDCAIGRCAKPFKQLVQNRFIPDRCKDAATLRLEGIPEP
jgi:hypothetical protein